MKWCRPVMAPLLGWRRGVARVEVIGACWSVPASWAWIETASRDHPGPFPEVCLALPGAAIAVGVSRGGFAAAVAVSSFVACALCDSSLLHETPAWLRLACLCFSQFASVFVVGKCQKAGTPGRGGRSAFTDSQNPLLPSTSPLPTRAADLAGLAGPYRLLPHISRTRPAFAP